VALIGRSAYILAVKNDFPAVSKTDKTMTKIGSVMSAI